ncbi:F-box family protein [Rhynchospora pubera]|uniref:F-box family protein n=1 Tax=Rhynchospora pubera TaxID=906938 RepID=A0AAV8CBF6_9POAL|nr:F-box family protein [Rhynchospora pubera]
MEEEADRISFLPEEIKISILSRLRLKYAVRTSALARSWRRIWTLLPSLCLDRYFDPLGLPLPVWYTNDPVTPNWIERVHHLVSSLRGPLLAFRLSHNLRPDQSPLLQSLLHLLLQKGLVETLKLYTNRGLVPVHLPPFQYVKVLELWRCNIILPPTFCGFNSLTTLVLIHVEISNHHLHLLIHASTHLTTLVLRSVTSKDSLSLNINLPLLRHLKFGIHESAEKVSVISAPCLEQAEISIAKHTDNGSEKLPRVTLGLVTSVAMASSLHLDCDVVNFLSLVTLPFNFTFPRLRCLKLFLNIINMDKGMHDVFIWFLRCMPFLEELKVKVLQFGDNSSMQTNKVKVRELLLKKQDDISCLNQTLKSVTIGVDIADVMTSITVVKFFLLNAKVLKLMKIRQYEFCFEPSMIMELQKVKMASLDAKVVLFSLKGEVNVR